MAGEVHSFKTRVHLKGYDISQYLKGTSSEDNIDVVDVSTLTDQFGKRYIAGLEDGSFSADGVYVHEPGAIREAIDSATFGKNRISNPSFEVDTSGWSAAGVGTTLTRVNTQAHDGTWSAQLVCPGTIIGEGLNMTPNIVVEPNNTYTFSAWVRAPVGAQLRLRHEQRDAGGAVIDSRQTSFIGTGGWEKITSRHTHGPLGVQAHAEITNNNVAQAHTFHVDDVRFSDGRIAGITCWPDGDAIGKPGEGLGGVTNAKAVQTPIGDAVLVSIGMNSNLGVEDLVSLAPMEERGGGGGLTSVGNGDATNEGAVGYLHVVDAPSGLDSVTWKIQHSTDNAVWVDLILFELVQSDNYFIRKFVPGLVNRWLRAHNTTTGASVSTAAVAVGRNPSNPNP